MVYNYSNLTVRNPKNLLNFMNTEKNVELFIVQSLDK